MAHRRKFLTGVASGLGLFAAQLAVLVSIVFFKQRLVTGLHVGLHRLFLRLGKLAVFIGIILLEHLRFALFHFRLHLLTHGLLLVIRKLAILVRVEFFEHFGRDFALRPIRAFWFFFGGGKCAGPDEGTEGDECGRFHGWFSVGLRRLIDGLEYPSNLGSQKRLRDI